METGRKLDGNWTERNGNGTESGRKTGRKPCGNSALNGRKPYGKLTESWRKQDGNLMET